MKLSWTEPWSRNLLRHRVREANLAMPSIRAISIGGGVIAFCTMLGVRWCLPESCVVLTWEVVAIVTICCSLYGLVPYLIAVCPRGVHLSEKGVFSQCGSGGSFLPRELIRSISFEDRDGFHLLVLRCVTKRGKSFERTVVASTKYSDDDVAKFLFDIGMAHLWNAGIEV